MRKNLIFSLLVLFSFIVVQSCSEEFIPADELQLELDFYPVDSLTTWEFVMDSIIYDNEGLAVRTSSSFLREQIVSKTFDDNGIPIYKIEIARKSDFFDEYFVTDIWTLRIENNSIIRNEENLNFVKLKMPPVLGANWNGTPFPEDVEVYIEGDPIEMYLGWDSKFSDRLMNESFSGVVYEDVLQVTLADSDNGLNGRFATEYYAKGVGLIRREIEIYDTQQLDFEIAWVDKVHQGFSLTQKLIDSY